MRSLFLAFVLVSVADCVCSAEAPVCGSDDACVGGKVCVDGVCEEAVACSLDDPCGDGFTCSAVDADDSGACKPIVGKARVNDACAGDDECDTGACSGDVCVGQCSLDDGCADGLRCVLDGPRRVCVLPTGDGATGDACDDARDCVSGTCVVAPGAEAALCAPSCDAAHACGGSDLCLALDAGARACLPPVEDGAPCTGAGVCASGLCIDDRGDGGVCASECPAPQAVDSCADGFLCVDDDADGRVCMPVRNEFADGEACVDERDCGGAHICGHYVADGFEADLCARVCPDDGCAADEICWPGEELDLCGPIPP